MRSRILALLTLGLVAAIVMTAPEASVARQASSAVERTGGEAVGASITHPANWTVERERHTYDGTYGFTLWRPEPSSSRDHSGIPAVRVALAYGMSPGQIDDEVRQKISYYENEKLAVGREAVSVGEEGHRGVAVGPIPGSTPSTEVYVPVNGRVYRINVYSEAPGGGSTPATGRCCGLCASRNHPDLSPPSGYSARTRPRPCTLRAGRRL